MIPGSHGKIMFSFVRNFQIVSQSGCTTCHSHQHWVRVPFNPHLCKYLVVVVFWILAILIGM